MSCSSSVVRRKIRFSMICLVAALVSGGGVQAESLKTIFGADNYSAGGD